VRHHPRGFLLDPGDRGAEPDPVRAELLGHPQREQLRPAGEPVLLRRPGYLGELPEPARRPQVEQHVQQGYLTWLTGEYSLAERLDGEPANPGPDVVAGPVRQRPRVGGRGPGCPPGRLYRDPAGHPVEAEHGPPRVGQLHRVQPRHGPVVVAALANLEHRPAAGEDRNGRHAELTGQPEDVPLGGAHELPANIDDVPAGQGVVQHPPADPVPRLEDDDVTARRGQFPGRGQPGQARPDHDHIGLGRAHGSHYPPGLSPLRCRGMPTATPMSWPGFPPGSHATSLGGVTTGSVEDSIPRQLGMPDAEALRR